jgi:hypothetical protein
MRQKLASGRGTVPVARRLRNLTDVMAITKCLICVPPVRGFTVAARGLLQCVPRPATKWPFAGLMEPIIMSNASDELRKLRNAELDAAPIRHLNEEELRCVAGGRHTWKGLRKPLAIWGSR